MIRPLHLEESSNGEESSGDAAHADVPHVLLVLDQFPKTLGGGERIVLKLAGLLPQYGYRVSILTFSAHPDSAGLKSPPCSVYLLPLQRTYDLAAMRGSLDLRKFLKEQRIRIVQTFFESSDIWAGFVTKAMSNAKLIWSRRDMGILRTGKHHAAYRLMAGAPDKVFAVSEQVRRHCIEVDGVDPSRVQTVYNGLDLADWNAASKSEERVGESVVATVGNIRRVKGHDVFIRAAASVAEKFPHTSFRIAGDVLEPEYFAELQALVSELKLSDRFHFVGGVTNLRDYLSAADVFVLPSRSEGFSNAIVEAMAAALPVVATNVGGNAEAVQDGVSGIIVPPDDPDAIASAIVDLLSDTAKAKQMGAAGNRLAAEKFTTEAMMGQITRVYASLLRGE
ncbi:GT4 family glycosyltransferase PelF [Tunturibacter empetritectus]|uniref:Glycosyltransferase involved in cell wall biosynthesis n=1 Tax=Tunturiibacter lichenicola TaxID=2051959 RepID=A0A7W8J743_9BACT|nr:GT4 family glycosyltransferase PelF [Edaphobacter lichenicola]MBB5342507.1 glycosyltransferase involved in cell wall biosynthesis [Edaphobacter lichenicola]